jgi:hypothetical protein
MNNFYKLFHGMFATDIYINQGDSDQRLVCKSSNLNPCRILI